MIKFSRRGSVLVHVLVTGVIVAFIAAGLLRMVLMNYSAVDRVNKNNRNKKEAEAMLQRAVSAWNTSRIVCSSSAAFPCVGVPGACNCNCPNIGTTPHVNVSGGPPPAACNIQIISNDPL